MRMLLVVSLLLAGAPARAADSLAATPPMGWNSWNKFGCNVSESLLRATADALVSTGMKDAGYQYLVIDDCWQVSRDAAGRIVPDSQRFPSGMKALADYVHGKGLRFGLYSDAGTGTCEKRPGSKGHEQVDAQGLAEPDLLGFFCLPLHRPEFRHFVRAVAKRLLLRAAAGTPPIALAGFQRDRNGPPAADFRHCTRFAHAVPPPAVASHASPQALASSRTRRM